MWKKGEETLNRSGRGRKKWITGILEGWLERMSELREET